MPIPKPRKGEKQSDFISRCMGDAVMVKEYPEKDQRSAVCFNTWRNRNAEGNLVMERHFVTLRGMTGKIRTETFRDRLHTVIPVVALVEGVMQAANSPTPELVESMVFSKTTPAWNGRPVVVNHPRRNGELVSANAPDMLETEQFGQIFGSAVDNKKLVLEAWLDNEAADGAEDDKKEVLDLARNGETVEVSIGAFVDVEPRRGEFDGRAYEGRWTNVVPDHLAILTTDKVGACSVEAGCGTNRAAEGMRCGPGCKCCKEVQEEQEVVEVTPDPSMLERLKGIIKGATSDVAAALGLSFAQRLTVGELSDMDRRGLLESALQKAAPNDFIWVVAVYEDRVVYAQESKLFQRNFAIKDDSEVTFGEEVVEVTPRTDFIAVKNSDDEESNQRTTDMEKSELINVLITDPRTRFAEDDQEYLNGLEVDMLEKMLPAEVQEVTLDAFLEAAPEPVRDVLTEGVSIRGERRRHFIDAILKCGEGDWTSEELDTLSMRELERLGRLCNAPTYFGRPVPTAMPKVDLPKAAPKLSAQFGKRNAS